MSRSIRLSLILIPAGTRPDSCTIMTDALIKGAFDSLAGPDGIPLCKLWDLLESLGIEHQQFKGQNCKRQVRDMIGNWDVDSDRFLSWTEFQEGPMIKIKELLENK